MCVLIPCKGRTWHGDHAYSQCQVQSSTDRKVLLLHEVGGAMNVLLEVSRVKRKIKLFKPDREGCKYKFLRAI